MFKAYANEEDSLGIGGLTVENRMNCVEIYGSLAITKDKEGLRLALQLKDVIDSTLKVLQSAKLPERIQNKPTDTVDNPFA
jgi:hypothetical protein